MSASPEMRPCPSNSSIMRAISTSLMLVDDNYSNRFYLKEEDCRTPKAEEFRIPSTVEICPPAPKKMKPTVLPCRRKLQVEMKFIHVKHEETKGLFEKLFCDLTSKSSSDRKRKRCVVGAD